MNDSCPVQTPEDARCTAVILGLQKTMLDRIAAAIDDAYDAALREIGQDGAERPMPPRDYFTAVAHHRLFIELCKADPETSKGGRPAIAAAILRNFQRLAGTWSDAPAG